LIPKEEPDAKWQRDKITEEGAEVKENDRSQEDENLGSQFFEAKYRGKRFPHLIKNQRNRKKETRIDGQFDHGEKGLRNGKGNQVFLKRGMEMVQQPLGEWINDDSQ
jgi:hypothetical protein